MTKVIIVDKDDNQIGLKERDQLVNGQDIIRVSGLWIKNSKGQILIAQRKFTKKNDPGKWGPAVVGTVEEGETYESNIYKEADEEIGLIGKKFIIGPKAYVGFDGQYFAQWYTCQLDAELDSLKPQEEEVEKLAWVDQNVLFEDIRTNPDKYVRYASIWEETFGLKS